MKMLSREEILKTDDLPVEIIEVPEWNGSVKVQAFSLSARNQIYNAAKNGAGVVDPEKVTVLAFINSVIEPKFEARDYDALKVKSGKALDRVVTRILELSGMREDQKNVLKAI